MSRSRPEWVSAWSVTRVLARREAPRFLDEAALERGIAVHAWAAAHDEGAPYTIQDEDWIGYTEAWKRFSHALTPSWTHVEHVFDTGRYHGIIDRAGSIRGRDVVVDLKTGEGGSSPRTPLQIAAYTQALHPSRFHDIQRIEVRLSRSGRYRVITHRDPADFLVWDHLLREALNETPATITKGENHGNSRPTK